ncbi:hypothetical protein FHR71_005276 [Methylobacterium sp. RAS18]|nr:hypothetical protein [Methylobacterium sp. RAS18]
MYRPRFNRATIWLFCKDVRFSSLIAEHCSNDFGNEIEGRWRSQGKRGNQIQNSHLASSLGISAPIDLQRLSGPAPNPLNPRNENAVPGVGARNGDRSNGTLGRNTRRDHIAQKAVATSTIELAIVIEGDRRFFDRHADRHHRIRHMSRAEAADFAARGLTLPLQPDGWRWFVAVKRVPMGRIRSPFGSPEDAEVDLPEDLARCLFLAAENANHTGLGYGVVSAEAMR